MATENPMRVVDSGRAGKWALPIGTRTRVGADELGLLLRGAHCIAIDQSSVAPNRSGSAPPSMEGSFAAFGNNRTLPLMGSHGCGPGGSLSTHEEEHEDDRSPKRASGNRARSNSITFMPGKNMFSFNGHHKSLGDHIQADFPRTLSPMFSQNHTSSLQVEEQFHHEMQNLSLDSGSVEASKEPEMQPILPAAPMALPPVYTTTAAYMSPGNSIYANFCSSGLYPPHTGYSMGKVLRKRLKRVCYAQLEQVFSPTWTNNATNISSSISSFVPKDPYGVPLQGK